MQKILFIIGFTAFVLFVACSCRVCPAPKNITNGKAAQKHDSRKFRASIRIMRVKQYGPFCKVRYENKKYTTDRLYENCDCGKFPVGTWVNEDSINN